MQEITELMLFANFVTWPKKCLDMFMEGCNELKYGDERFFFHSVTEPMFKMIKIRRVNLDS